LFVITKKFNGQRLSSVEHQDGPSQLRYLSSLLKEISEDPRLTISIEVKPLLLRESAPAISA
jgi:hypothetical protein